MDFNCLCWRIFSDARSGGGWRVLTTRADKWMMAFLYVWLTQWRSWNGTVAHCPIHLRKFAWNPKLNPTWRDGRWLYILFNWVTICLGFMLFFRLPSGTLSNKGPHLISIWQQTFMFDNQLLQFNTQQHQPLPRSNLSVQHVERSVSCYGARIRNQLFFANSGNSWRSIYVVVKHPCERMI